MSPSARWALLGILVLAFLLRALGFEQVFLGDGDVVFALGDPYYHLRLAHYTWMHFPEALQFDAYVNFPDGTVIGWAPLYDRLVAGSAILAGNSVHALEVVAAWWPPVLATLCVLAVYSIGSAAGGAGLGLGAALIFALLPASAILSRVGYADHHAAVGLCGATLLACQVRTLQLEPDARRWLAMAVVLCLVRTAVVLVWGGSLTYLGVADVSFVLAATALGRCSALVAEAASLAATAALVAPHAALVSPRLGGPFSSIEVSWLHVVACIAMSLWALACHRFASGGARSSWARLVLGVGLGSVVALTMLAVPGLRDGIARALGFLGKTDVWSTTNPEQAFLYSALGGRLWAEVMLGHLGYLVPVAPLVVALRARRAAAPGPLVLVAAWSAALGALAVLQVRFAGELAASASVAFAVLLAWVGSGVAARLHLNGRARALPALVLGGALLWPALRTEHAPYLFSTLSYLREGRGDGDPALRSAAGSLVRFAQTVRETTPETSGFLDPGKRPEYGILSDPSLGHVLHYVARRATPSDNFGPYAGVENFLATLRVLLGASEEEALGILEQLETRYVVTSWQPVYQPGSLLGHLHVADGAQFADRASLRHFRLIAEGPRGGLPLASIFASGAEGVVPYKLFEVVPGAVLEVPGRSGAQVVAALTLETDTERRFVYRATATVDADGWARLRVPYATRRDGRVHALGPYRVLAGGEMARVEVEEAAILGGATVPVAGVGGPPPSQDVVGR